MSHSLPDAGTTGATRDRVIEAGLRLFNQHGFHAVGLDLIYREAGVSKRTFFNHFPSRDDLVLAVIQRRDADWRALLHDQTTQLNHIEPAQQLLAIFDLLVEWFNTHDFNGCMLTTACGEYSNPHDPCHRAAKAGIDHLRNHIAQLAKAAGVHDPPTFAIQFHMLIGGAIATAVIDRQSDATQLARQMANLLLAPHTHTTPPT